LEILDFGLVGNFYETRNRIGTSVVWTTVDGSSKKKEKSVQYPRGAVTDGWYICGEIFDKLLFPLSQADISVRNHYLHIEILSHVL